MRFEAATDREALKRLIENSLRTAEMKATRSRSASTWLLVTRVVTAAATTLVSAVTAASGPVVGEGPTGWKISCAIAAFLGFATTVCISLNQVLGLGQRVSRANACAGRLQSLDVSLKTSHSDWDKVSSEYETILRDFPEEIRRSGQ